MDLTFFLEGASASEIIRTSVIAGIVCWALHHFVIKRDIQQIVNSNQEIKNQLKTMKSEIEDQIESELSSVSGLPIEVQLLKQEITHLKEIICVAYNIKKDLPLKID